MIAFETKGLIDKDGFLTVEQPIALRNRKVRVLVLLPEDQENTEWLQAVSSNPALDFLADEAYSDKQASLAPDVIVSRTHTYTLFGPLRCLLEKEDDYHVISCEILDLVGTGSTIEEAKQSFADEFEYIYTRYNALPDEELTKRLQSIKTILNALVKQVDTHARP